MNGSDAAPNDASPFPTDLATDGLFRAAVRLSNAISAREAQLASQDPPDSPLSPLTASSTGTPEAPSLPPPAPDEVRAALDEMLAEMTDLRLAPDFTDTCCSSDTDACSSDEASSDASASSFSTECGRAFLQAQAQTALSQRQDRLSQQRAGGGQEEEEGVQEEEASQEATSTLR